MGNMISKPVAAFASLATLCILGGLVLLASCRHRAVASPPSICVGGIINDLQGGTAKSLNWFEFTGKSGWAANTNYDLARVAGRFVAGDFNGDGKADLAALQGGENATGRIHVWLSNGKGLDYQGDGGWAETTNRDLNGIGGRMVPGDFNGDGKCDVATIHGEGDGRCRILVWLSAGGSFQYQGDAGWAVETNYDLAKVQNRVVAGDFNGDGKADLATFYDHGEGQGRIHVWLSTGTCFLYQGARGWAQRPQSNYDLSKVADRFVSGDFNGDGRADVATLYDEGNDQCRVHVWLSSGTALAYQGPDGWADRSLYSLASVQDRLVSGDFNGDGKSDLSAFFDTGTLVGRQTVWLSSGTRFVYQTDGGWDARNHYNLARGVSNRYVAGDFNGDRLADTAAWYACSNSAACAHVWLARQVAKPETIRLDQLADNGTLLVFAHQDDDLLWMEPFWGIASKFILAANPTAPAFIRLIDRQQQYLDGIPDPIDYKTKWVHPWGVLSDEDYFKLIVKRENPPPGAPGLFPRIPNATTDLERLKAMLEPYIADPSVKRIVTHNNWGEYGHQHHVMVNRAVRELGVKYGKDVWALGCLVRKMPEFVYKNVELPGFDYLILPFNHRIYESVKSRYLSTSIGGASCWTWISGNRSYSTTDDAYPRGYRPFLKIVAGGKDLTIGNAEIEYLVRITQEDKNYW